jgi:hypothetical protein
MTTHPNPVMTLEETKAVLREDIAICDQNIRICDENLYDEEAALLRRHKSAYESALHHLEAGKAHVPWKDVQQIIAALDYCAVGNNHLHASDVKLRFFAKHPHLSPQPSQQERQ